MEYIDTYYYCNLAHRTDRNQQILSEFEKLGIPTEKIHRIDSIYTPNFGILGCGKSHIEALKHFLASEKKICVIFEDDFTCTESPARIQEVLRTFFENHYHFDCLMLSGNILQSQVTNVPFILKVIDAQCCSSYVITREFASMLLEVWLEASRLQEDHISRTGTTSHWYCLDIAWKQLQPSLDWFVVEPKIGIQRVSYSDIEKKVTDYKV